MASELGWRAQAAHALLTLAASSYDLFESDRRLIRTVRRCLAGALDLPDASLEVRARNVLAIMHGWRSNFDGGLAEYERATARVEASDGSTRVSLLAGNVANLAVRKADAAKAGTRAAAQAEAQRGDPRAARHASELAARGRAIYERERAHARTELGSIFLGNPRSG